MVDILLQIENNCQFVNSVYAIQMREGVAA